MISIVALCTYMYTILAWRVINDDDDNDSDDEDDIANCTLLA